MIGRRVVPALASMAIAIGSLSACGSDSGSTPDGGGNAAQSSPAVAWIDKVCASLTAGGQELSSLPQIEGSDPAQAKEGLVTFLTKFTDQLTTVAKGITDAGVPPVTDGQAAVDKAQATIDGAKTSLESAKTKLAAVSATDPLAFQQALAEISPTLTALDNTEGPVKDLRANSELNQAFGQAANCKQVGGSGSDSTVPTS